jgi:hypothetical protein
MDMFRSTESRSLVGILPAFTISKSKFKDIISTSINLIEYQKDCIQFMKTNMKHKFIIQMTHSCIMAQKSKGIELLVGKGSNQRKMKIMPILVNFNCDNEECFSQQLIYMAAKARCNCRFCNMCSYDFYNFPHCKAILFGSQRKEVSRLSKTTVIDLCIATQDQSYPLRDTNYEKQLVARAEISWWKKALYNKNNIPIRNRQRRANILLPNEEHDLHFIKNFNLKPHTNILYDKIFGFFNEWGTQPSIIPYSSLHLLFPADRLHTLWKGNIELNFRYSSIIILIIGNQNKRDYGSNITILDDRMINFDIHQPNTSTPYSVKRFQRLPGISSTSLLIFY